MEVQNQVGRCLRANLARLHGVLDSVSCEGLTSLGQVADRLCEAFDLRDGRGRWQRASCRKALDVLEAQGEVVLPAPRTQRAGGHGPRVLAHPVAPAHDVPGTVGAVRELELVRVESDAQRRVWNTLMAHEHPRGAGPFVGHQLRYLVGSAHGWLGAVGFAVLFRRLSEDGFLGLFGVIGAWISHIGSSLPDREEAGGGRTAVGASSRFAAPSLRYGPAGDPPPSVRRSASMAVSAAFGHGPIARRRIARRRLLPVTVTLPA